MKNHEWLNIEGSSVTRTLDYRSLLTLLQTVDRKGTTQYEASIFRNKLHF